ncbi:MAG: protein kinase domain-containing protein [Terriglobales bacterium]
MPISSGTKLGTYEILSAIGAGGMGEVYRARDTRLGRDVAIKVLPESFQQDGERLARFEREAQLLASVNHANIAAIYGLEESNGAVHLVLELVPGETLAQRLTRGRLPLDEALSVCLQVAQALEAAHEKGIIHRDLKPANIKVTPEGQVKVLDFGLAKSQVVEDSSRSDSDSPTASLGGTSAGLVLGTASYMSPEQARGKLVDKRTDVWSFGCVLYEALSGRRAFTGETPTDILAAIIEREPDWGALPPSTPDGIRRLLRRCLQKDRKRRTHDIADARLEIEEMQAQPAAVGQTERGTGFSRRLLWLAGAAGAAVGAALALWVSVPGKSVSAEAPHISQVARLTHDPGLSEWPTWSPDGKLLAFASNRSGNFEIYVRRIEGGHEVNVTNDPGQDYQPAFSPDGQWIAFVSTRSSRTGMIKIGATFGMEFRTFGGDLWVAPALGGPARRLATDANFPAWHPDGKRIAYVSGKEGHRAVLEIPVVGGEAKTLLAGNDSRWEAVKLQYSPDGRWLSLGAVDPEKILLLPLAAGGKPKELVSASTHVWAPSGGRLYYLKRDALGGTRLESVAVGNDGSLQAPPETIGVMTGILRDLAVSGDGRSLAVSEMEGSMNLTLQPLQAGGGAPAGPEQPLTRGQALDRYPAFSPDGKHVAYSSNRLGPQEVWILEIASGHLQKLPVPTGYQNVSLPYWSPDGHKIAMTPISADGKTSLWLLAVDGSEASELVPPTKNLGGNQISPDGSKLLYETRSGEHLQLFEVKLATRQSRQLTSSPSDKSPLVWSPDGRQVLYASTADGAMQVWRMPAEGGKEEQLTFGHERMRHAFYSPDGKWIYVQPSHRNIYRIPASGGVMQPVTRFPESGLFLEEPTISPDGRSLLYCRSNGGSSLWLITLEAGK